MANLHGFDASKIPPASDLGPLPSGEYPAAITESSMKPTKSRTGRFLEMKFQILEGEYQGRSVLARLNLENRNSDTVQFAKAELSAICRAVGVITPQDSSDLHNLPLTISVECRKRADTGETVNEINGYFMVDAPAAVSTPPTPSNGTNPTPNRPPRPF